MPSLQCIVVPGGPHISTAEVLPLVTFEDFLAGEQGAERPHEWVAGRVYAMAGGTERHDLMVGLVYEALAPAADRRGGRPFAHKRLVRLREAAYYPDVLVVCPDGRRPDRHFEHDLSWVVEVLSPSTRNARPTRKGHGVQLGGVVRAVRHHRPGPAAVEVATRTDLGLRWDIYTSGHVVPQLELDVDGLYDALECRALT